MTVKRIAVSWVLDRMHAHCLTDNKAKNNKSKQQLRKKKKNKRK